jgi:hypothetical protein
LAILFLIALLKLAFAIVLCGCMFYVFKNLRAK